VVASGSAVVTNGEQEIFVRSNESAHISAGVAHRLANPGVIDCVMIEVHRGDYGLCPFALIQLRPCISERTAGRGPRAT
jgi:hypothetical protein